MSACSSSPYISDAMEDKWLNAELNFIEASRTDSLIFFGFKIAQIVSVIMIIIGICLIINSAKKSKYEDLYNDINNI